MEGVPELLRVKDVAPILGVSRSRVYQLVASGLCPAVRIAGSIRVPRAALARWLGEQAEDALASLRRE